MKNKEAFLKLADLLLQKYGSMGFKYSKTEKYLIKKTANFHYLIAFHSFAGNKEGKVLTLNVNLIISDRRPSPFHALIGGLFFISLSHYNIATDLLIGKAAPDIMKEADRLLIPFVDKLENNIHAYRDEWVKYGFFGAQSEYGFVVNLEFINENYGKQKAEECLANYVETLSSADKLTFKKAYAGKMAYGNYTIPFRNISYGMFSSAKDLKLQLR